MMKNTVGSYVRLSRALSYYSEKGFQFIDVPWIVSDEAIYTTFKGYKYHSGEFGTLVGSSEQSFVQLMIDGKLEEGRYCAITPCFRDDQEDEYHSQTFMKVELIDTETVNEISLFGIISMCEDMFSSIIEDDVAIIKTDEGYDIMYKGIELGSYGIRSYNNHRWIYATGLAEPRMTQVMSNKTILDKNIKDDIFI